MSVFRRRSKSDSQTEFTCSIRFLDDSETIQLSFKKDTLGQWLMDRVCEKLNLLEKDYFGLRHVDADNQRHWLDPLKPVHKQLKGANNKAVLCFRVKFYPEDPMKLHEEITRYYLFLQLRRDLHHGRLLCPQEDSIQLAAYIIQSEVGDYDPQDHPAGYISEFKMLPKQTAKHEEKIMEAHMALVGQVPSDSEANFLKKAASMDTYGVDPHQVKDQKGDQLYLGVTHRGIMTFRGSRQTQLFKWNLIRRIAYEEKLFIVHYSSSEDFGLAMKALVYRYKCTTPAAAKHLWRCAVEQQLFFTLSSSSTVPKIRSGGTIFSRGSKFRFSGRCQNEAYEASENIHRSEPAFNRTSSLPNFGKKPATKDIKYNTLRDSVVSEGANDDRRKYNVYLAPGRSKEEAAVDVPSIFVNEVIIANEDYRSQELYPGSVQAPLADQEGSVEDLIEESVTTNDVQAAPPVEVKENGQAVKDLAEVLDTSLEEETSYQPNQTFDDSDDEPDQDESHKIGLDEQIKQLDDELSKTFVPTDMQSSPAKQKSKPASNSKPGVCGKALAFSLLTMLLLSFIAFYVLFFSSFKHPLASSLRKNLQFLEPVAHFVGDKTTKMVSFFKK